ncbi:hypothetical protein [Streptomyces sp. JV180]|uniref:hypothetical protein n=1 Tax=Streptomyces sp. JV180 TaxID=858634 RepID=UPI00168B2192|nr:hypothetical protein [Streptomyces sp. JV180]MBD3549897.1 hypothetical protein [Streptomyces sp. JV180]
MSRWDDLSEGAHKMLADFDELDLADIAASYGAAIQRVRALHRPVEHCGRTICVECSGWADGSTDSSPAAHPCATIKALDNQETT